MANRDGEFQLVIEPGNDGHIVNFFTVDKIVADLRRVIERAVELLDSDGKVSLYLTTSPEYGSIKFNFLAGMTAGAVLGHAADLSQVTGVNLTDIMSAMRHLIAPTASAAPTDETNRLLGDQDFRILFRLLLTEVHRSGYATVKMRGGGIEVDLTEPMHPDHREPEIERLKGEIKTLQSKISQLEYEDARHDNPRRRQFPGRAVLKQEIAQAQQRRVELDEALVRLGYVER